MKIVVEEERPIYVKPRRLPLTEICIIDRQVEEWLKEGIIEECACDYASPVVLVRRRTVRQESLLTIVKLIR